MVPGLAHPDQSRARDDDHNPADVLTAPARIRCLVPFCRRTRAAGGLPEWICGKHWALIPARRRRAYARARRIASKTGEQRAWKAAARLWRRLRAQACAAAGGLS